MVGKAHQRIIREQKAKKKQHGFFEPPISDIKKAVLKEITFGQAKTIVLKYEWLGTMGTTQMHYGIFYEGVLAGVVCFGYFQAIGTQFGGHPYAACVGEDYAKKGTQLSRGACTHWAHEHSGSKLIAYGLKEMKKKGYKYCIAFSDPKAGEIGTLYQATNWYYLGSTGNKYWDIYYKNVYCKDGSLFKEGKIFLNDRDFFKNPDVKKSKKGMEEFISDKPGLELRLRESKARYIKLLGNKYENKEMLECLKSKIKLYPKRLE